MSDRAAVTIVLLALIGVSACGASDSSPNAELASLPEAASPPLDVSIRVQADVDLSPAIAGRLEPLDEAVQAPMSMAEALDIVRSNSLTSRFFEASESTPEVRLGVFVAEHLGEDAKSVAAGVGVYERFVAYVISGGSDVCVRSGPPRDNPDEQPAVEIPCSVLVVVDAEHRTLPWIVEQG